MFDLQVNGLTIPEINLHCDFWQAPADADIEKLCEFLGSEGITGFYATLITAPYEEIDRNLSRIAGFLLGSDSSILAGVHIEGGYISRPGIHPLENLREFDLAKVRSLVEKYPGLIKLWTLCPLVDADGAITKYLQSQGIRVAYGHSNATANEADKAFDSYGVDLVTHWPNAMTIVRDPIKHGRFDHRNPSTEYLDFLAMSRSEAEAWASVQGLELGLGFSAYHRKDVSVTAICGSAADGDMHMAAEIFSLLRTHKGTQMFLVSDDVAYSTEELKAGRILGLRGGRVSLAKHFINAQKI